MAFNVQTFRVRTISSLIFVAIMLAGLLVNQWTFFLLFSIIHFGCWIEYQKVVGLIDPEYQKITPIHKYGVMIAGWCIMLYFTNNQYDLFGVQLHELGWWIGLLFIFVLPITELLFTNNIRLKNIGHSFFGLIYISLSWGLMMDLYGERNVHIGYTAYILGKAYLIPLAIIISIWLNDTLAYLVGSLIGRTSLTKISPKKTWEGTIGGIVLSTALVGIAAYYIYKFGSISLPLTIMAALAAITGTFGDLLESKLKRLANIKDTGSMLPGHGGFLDRFDSLLVAVPFVWLFIRLFIETF